MLVHPNPLFGQNADASVARGLECRLRQRLHAHEPLVAEPRLDDRVAPVAVPHGVLMLLGLHESSRVVEQRRDALPRVEPVHAAQLGGDAATGVGHLVHRAVHVDDDRRRQGMSAPDFEIVRIMRWRDLHGASAELGICVLVRDDGNRQIHDRQQDIPPDERRIPFVARVHGHGDVAEHRLGARRGDDDAARGIVLHRIGDVVEGAARLLAFGLFVGKGRQAARTPVNHAVSPIDEPTLEKAHEALAHRDAQLRAERVRRAGPVRRRADGLELLEDDSARLMDERARPLDEPLASEILARASLGGELLLDDVLRCDAGVIGAGNPERFASLHPCPAHEHVLHRVVQAMSDVENGGDVRRRHDDAVRLAIATNALEPPPVDVGLGGRGIIRRRKGVRRLWGG